MPHLDELLARRPAELIPLVNFGVADAAELNANGIGLHRKPVEWGRIDGYDGEAFAATWVATGRDWLPCTVARIGVALEPGGPAAYTLAVSAVDLCRVGDALTVRFAWPVRV